MGFWTNWKNKRKEKKQTVVEVEKNQALRINGQKDLAAKVLEESEKEKFNRPIIKDLDIEMSKTNQKVDDLIDDPHMHSQGFISPKQGVHVFVEDILESPNLEKKKKNSRHQQKELKKQQKEALKKQKLEKAMLKSALTFSEDIKKLSKKFKETNNDFFEELEEVLIRTDMGMEMVLRISNNLQKKLKKTQDVQEMKECLVEELYNAYDSKNRDTKINFLDNRLNIFMIVGVNGTGKTTSLAKLANYYAKLGKKIMVIAGDTFRAGAVEQLEEWIKSRLTGTVTLVKGKPGQDPSSVIFDGLQQARAKNFDLVLIDTAGRIQNKINLMNELKKMHSVVHKFDKNAPHEVLLTIDATTGQNGTIQAHEFSEITNVSGIILTKMDGTSKGGIALAIKDKLNIPIKMVGLGEQIDDFAEFDVEDYIYGLVVGFMDDEEVNDKDGL